MGSVSDSFDVVEVGSTLESTPAGMYAADRLMNFCRGYHGDTSLYKDPVLDLRMKLAAEIERKILIGDS